MTNSNEILAKNIKEILIAEGLINSTDKEILSKLANGQMKDIDWKVALEEIINMPKDIKVNENETE